MTGKGNRTGEQSPARAPVFSVTELHSRTDGFLTCDQLAGWLVEYSIARPNGSPDSFELTAYGADMAAAVTELRFWLEP